MGTRQQKNLKASAWPLNFASSAPWLAHHHLHIKIPLQNEKMTRTQQMKKIFCSSKSMNGPATTWPFFLFTARKYSSNGPTAIFHTFFLAERCRLLSGKDPLQKSTMTSIDGKIFWQMASLDSRQYVSRNVYLPFIWSYGWEKRWTRIGSNCIWLGSVLTLSDETCRYFALWHFTHFTNDELWTLTKRLYIFFTFYKKFYWPSNFLLSCVLCVTSKKKK